MKTSRLWWVAAGAAVLTLGGCPGAFDQFTSQEAVTPADNGEWNTDHEFVPIIPPTWDDPAAVVRSSGSWSLPPTSSAAPSSAGGGTGAGGSGAAETAGGSGSATGTTNGSSTNADGTNDNGGDGAGGGESGGTPTEPPAGSDAGEFVQVTDAVDFVARQFAAVAAVYSAFGELGDPRLAMDPNTLVKWGTCPEVSIASSNEISLIGLDFGSGCNALCAGGRHVGGSNGEIYWLADDVAAVYVTSTFSVDGHAITPHLVHPRIRPDLPVLMNADMAVHAAGVTLDGPCDFATASVGRASGAVTVEIGRAYVLTFTAATLTLASEVEQLPVTVTTAVVRPATYSNFVPDSGTADFTVNLPDGDHSVTVAFDAASPTTGVVHVAVDGGLPFTYVLPDDLW